MHALGFRFAEFAPEYDRRRLSRGRFLTGSGTGVLMTVSCLNQRVPLREETRAMDGHQMAETINRLYSRQPGREAAP